MACAHGCTHLKNVAKLPENVKILPDESLRDYYSKIFPIDYPILPGIRNIHQKLCEGGIISRIFKNDERMRIVKAETVGDISLTELGYVFYFEIFASLFALIVFVIEVAGSKQARKLMKSVVNEDFSTRGD